MKYLKVFNEIVSIVNNDYAGHDEKKGWGNPDPYIEKIDSLEKLTPQVFMELVNEYIDEFQDPHMFFQLDGAEIKAKTCGFKVRRYEDALYVTEIDNEERFELGDKILAVDGVGINELSSSKLRKLPGTHHEREDWSAILNKSSTVEVMRRNGKKATISLEFYEPSQKESIYKLDVLDSDTLLLTFPDFYDYDAITTLIKENEHELQNYKKLIIDVRNNNGGNANAFFHLLPYIFSKGEKPNPVIPVREFNCTERNVNLFKQQVEEAVKITDEQATLQMLQETIKLFEQASGQGFVSIDFSQYISELDSSFEGKDLAPEHVIVLTDYYCASAGDEFVEVCKGSSKVTVLGRATKGITDYSDLLTVQWDEKFNLYYPFSRLKSKTKIDPVHGKGVQPDIYLPWTPQHIEKDIDLQKALDLVQV